MKVTALEGRIAALLGRDHPQSRSEIQLESAGLVMNGHFELHGEFHSSKYIRFSEAFYTSEAGKNTMELFYEQLRESKIPIRKTQIVLGPKRGGAWFAQAFAPVLADKLGHEVVAVPVTKHRTSDAGCSINPDDERLVHDRYVLIVDDVWNTGLTLAGSVMPLVRIAGGKIIGIAVLANRGKYSLPPLCPFEEYWRISSTDCFRVQDCPMCKAGDPMTKF